MRLRLLSIYCCVILASCDLISYHPYDVDISGQTDVNATNIALIESACLDKSTIRFALISDTQQWYDETEDFVNALNKRSDVDFVIHGGDISDFGMTDEFLWQRDILNGLDVPYVVIIGNHDCLGTGEETYAEVFGETNFSFIAGRVKFICLNTNALEYDYSEPVPDFTFIEEELELRSSEFDSTVFCMHAKPTTEIFNNNVANVFEYYITKFPNLLFCTAGHTHHFMDEDLFEDGVHYITSDCIEQRTYVLFTITNGTYEYEVVSF